MPINTDPFAPWNDPMYKNDPLAPHNDPMYKDDFMKPWNNIFGSENQLNDRDRKGYGILPKRRYEDEYDND